jgi:hypothetical protein
MPAGGRGFSEVIFTTSSSRASTSQAESNSSGLGFTRRGRMIRRDAGYIPGIAECISGPTRERDREEKAECRLYLDVLTAYLKACHLPYLYLCKKKRTKV